jgi:ABC-type amino acid transport substrate-binding protein
MKKFLTIAIVSFLSITSMAQAEIPKKLVVDVHPNEPMIFQSADGEWKGYLADHLTDAAKREGIEVEFRAVNEIASVFNGVRGGDAHLATGALTITSQRLNGLTAVPYFDGSVVMVQRSGAVAAADGGDTRGFILTVLALVGVVTVGFCIGMPLYYRKKGQPSPIESEHGLWACAGFMVLFLVMTIIAPSASDSTISAKNTSPDDYAAEYMATHTVAVKGGTTGEALAHKLGAKEVVPSLDVESSLQKVLDGSADVVLYDAPTLFYLMNSEKYAGKLEVVGRPFAYQPYGLYTQPGNTELTDWLLQTLTVQREDGISDAIYVEYLGNRE